MKHFIKQCLKSIYTTVIGTIAGLPTLIQGIHTKNATEIILGAGTILTGLVAKDSHQ